MTLEAQVSIVDKTKFRYLCTILRVEVLQKIDALCLQIGRTNVPHLIQVILSLYTYFFLSMNYLNKISRRATKGVSLDN